MKRICAALLSVAVFLVSFVGVGCQNTDGYDPLFKIYFLDVGQGDAALLRTAKGDILIDSGTEASEETLCLRLEQLGIESLLLVVLTHADEDHMGGADGVLSRFPTSEVWVGNDTVESEAEERMYAAATETNAEVRTVGAGEVCAYGDVTLSVLYPISSENAEGNEGSIVLKIACGETDLLLTGDAGVEQEKFLVERYGKEQLACDLYKVGHHGSNTSSSASFLAAMQPQYAVISCGAGNSYGHPTGEVIARLESVGAEVLRTDLLGEIVFESDGKTLVFASAKRRN